jgi:TonB family protein
MASRRRASPARWLAAFLAAAAAHALLLWLLAASDLLAPLARSHLPVAATGPATPPRPPTEDERPIEIEQLVDTLARPETVTPEEKKAEEQKKREEEDKDAKGQVVDIERPAIEARPDKANYLAEYDSRVARETRGRPGHDVAGAPHPVEGGAESRLPSPRTQPSGNPEARPGLPGRRSSVRERPSGLRGQEGSVDEVGPDGTAPRPGAAGERGGAPRPLLGEDGVPGMPGAPHPDLHPTEEMLNRAIAQGSGSPDWLRDIDDGESTALNAKKFKYASFFNRVKRGVAQEWHPDVVYVRHDPTGNVYGTKDRVTVLRVHLRPDGSVKELSMLQSSGVEFLDEEARDAFRRAQPFPNPPPQLVDGDGLIHFNFGFIFELSGRTSFKVLHY